MRDLVAAALACTGVKMELFPADATAVPSLAVRWCGQGIVGSCEAGNPADVQLILGVDELVRTRHRHKKN